ncbi:MAG TPA: DEAD/DEAH box helicase [Syntrophomonadaceae bacterium]|nr:DEAD/DEAH box helicase [Syntrophomonadaceae bacterium]
MGFEETTPIQARTIPLALTGKDLIGRAQTGTGKTAAYGIPLVEKCDQNNNAVQALVITPTRELAMQVAEELNRIGQYKQVKSLPIYGGQDIGRQIRGLKRGVQIVVGTPGRLMDHLRRRTLKVNQINMIVLDEADEMLNMGFREDIEEILKQMPAERQSLLFSATMPQHIHRLAKEFMNEPELISINPKQLTVKNIEQHYIELNEGQKLDVLCRLLDTQSPDMCIVFSRTKRRVDEIAEALSKRGYSAEGIHGDLNQSRRDQIMRTFKAGTSEILVATDVAARGLDISGVTHIYNFDIPQDPESYVHRIGRTGRAGEEGVALTFVTSREMGHLRLIENLTKLRIRRQPIPTMSEVYAGLQKVVIEELIDIIENEDSQMYKSSAQNLLNEYDSVTLLSAALKMMTKEPKDKPNVVLSSAPPISVKRNNPSNRGQKRFNDRRRDNKRSSSPKSKQYNR